MAFIQSHFDVNSFFYFDLCPLLRSSLQRTSSLRTLLFCNHKLAYSSSTRPIKIVDYISRFRYFYHKLYLAVFFENKTLDKSYKFIRSFFAMTILNLKFYSLSFKNSSVINTFSAYIIDI